MNQHVPNFIRRKQQPTKILPERKCKIRFLATHQQCGSAIGLHLMQIPECATQCNNDQFSILAKARSMFYPSVLEATYIKIRKPILCRQKEFVYSLQIFHLQRCSLSAMATLHRYLAHARLLKFSQSAFISIHYVTTFSNINATTFSFTLFQR